MATAFVQALGTNAVRSSGTSIAITVASLTVTVGNTIFVAFAIDDSGSAFGVTDNLGNTYSQIGSDQISSGAVKAQLWAAPVTAGGTLTSITMSWTGSVTSKAIAAAEFSGLGTLRLTDGQTFASGSSVGGSPVTSHTFFDGELWIGAAGRETNADFSGETMSGTPSQTANNAGRAHSTGGGAASNIGVELGYSIISGDSTVNGDLTITGSGTPAFAGAGAIYNAPAAIGPPAQKVNIYQPILAQ